MRPYYFGPPDRQLFGLYDPPAGDSSSKRGALICYPWGHECTNSRRIFRVLASRLANLDYHVMRVDYFGTGDSPGGGHEVSLDRWRQDIDQAARELEHSYGVEAVSLIGLRLGATLALLVAAQRELVERMVLWETIVDGAGYVEDLRSLHAAFLQRTLPRRLASDHQILGCCFGEDLARELRDLDLGTVLRPPARKILLMHEPGGNASAEVASLLGSIGSDVDAKTVEADAFWAKEIGANQAAVPPEALRCIVEFMDVEE